MAEETVPRVLDIRSILLDDLEPAPWNPMQDSQKNLDSLVANMRQHGFLDPPLVAPLEGDKYRILGGHDRVKAAKIVGLTEVPCSVIEGLSEEDQKFLTVRLNAIHKDLSPEKFLKLYQELCSKYSEEMVAAQMMFTDSSQMDKALKALKRQEKKVMQEKKNAVDDLATVVSEIFNRCGTQLDRGYAVFSFGGVDHVYIAMSEKLKVAIHQLVDRSEVENKHISELFEEALGLSE